MPDFQINTFVICDDIRREVNHKDILIGAYGSDLAIPVLPYSTKLSFWMEVVVKKAGPFILFLKIEAPNNSPSRELRIEFTVEEAQASMAIYTPILDILFEREGKLKIWTKSSQAGRYELTKSKGIRHKPFPPRYGPISPLPQGPRI